MLNTLITGIRPRLTLRLVNHILSGVVVLLALYIIFAPLLPQLSWWVGHDSPVKGLVAAKSVAIQPTQSEQPQADNLIIPRLDFQETIHGGDIGALNKGIWRIPHASTPDKGGNTVLVGHRFTYGGPAVFYHLDKLEKHDRIGVWWQGQLYEYEVFNIMVVPPETVSVEANTEEARLTLYTCTPLWSAKDRLVIQARLVEGES
jgi:sortase A